MCVGPSTRETASPAQVRQLKHGASEGETGVEAAAVMMMMRMPPPPVSPQWSTCARCLMAVVQQQPRALRQEVM